jgi:subtilisin family serine protease
MSVPGLFRSLVVGFFTLATVLVVPATASAATGTEYVIVNTDGSVTTRFLTTAQAEAMAGRASVRIVSPEQEFSVNETPTEIVTGLNTPNDAQDGDIIPNRYIVEFSSDVASRVAATDLSENVVVMYSHAISGFVADLDPNEVIDLQMNPNVISIEPDRVVSVENTQNGATWGLDRIDQRQLPLSRTYSYANQGEGVTAYILDTGVYAAHNEFSGRVTNGFTAINDGKGTDDCHGHGTHVAGTVAGTTYGVAKQATIVPVRVLGCTGSGSWSGVIAGIDWTIAHHQAGTPAVANMSLGGGASSSINSAGARAIADGITYVVAAGNSNADACRYSPASAPAAITVGASTPNDARASFSNWGRCLDVFAPGTSITSAFIGAPTALRTWQGTSMAAPHVAGVVALYLASHTAATPAQVSAAVLNAATRAVITGAGTESPTSLIYSTSFDPAPASAPSAPSLLRGTVSSGAVALTWTAPPSDGGAPLSDYIVEYSTSNGSSWTTFDDGVSTTTSVTVNNLTNFQQYVFRVFAVNSIGQSGASATVSLTPTLPGLASAPRSLVTTVGRERVGLSWSAPSSSGGGTITDYVIETSIDDGSTWVVYNDGVSTLRSVVLAPLVANTRYLIRVSAVNAAGVGAPSTSAVATPLSFNPPSVVRGVVTSPRVLGAFVSWSSPSDLGGGTLQGYIVDWSTDNGETWIGSVRTTASVRYAYPANLEGGVSHLVRVRALNQYGTSSDVTATVTPIALVPPSEPRSPYVSVGFNAARVYWSSPTSTGGTVVTGYFVEHSVNAGQSWTRSALVPVSRRSLSLTGLQGGQQHQFRVLAVNAIGIGAPSTTVNATPVAPTVASAPRSLSGFVSGSTGYLSWSSPISNGGAGVTGYNVELSNDNGASWSQTLNTASRSVRINNLVGGSNYLFRVKSVNSVGESAPSNVLTLQPRVAGTPNPPSRVSAVVNATSVVVSWAAVTSTFAPVTDYVVEYSVNNSSTWNVWNDGISLATSATLTNMTPNVSVSVRVKAVNRFGNSPASSVVTVVPRAAAVAPSEPVNVTATPGDGRVTVRWAAPVSDGGSAISSYTATASPGGATCVTSTNACVVTGLTNGTNYSFSVVARNAVGVSPASVATDPVAPMSSALAPVVAQSWGLDRADQRALPLDGQISRAGEGTGVDVYVIDTGVRASHLDFTSRVVAGFSAVADGRGTDDCHGHGTHVAGTVAGATYGFATKARIVPVRVLDCNGSGSSAGVIAGINWMIQHHVAGQPAVANLSLGGGFDIALNDAVERAVADGITVVVAAGNEATDACTKSPASAVSAITVGATTSLDSRASYSNVGGCVDIFAPGSSIISTGISSPSSTVMMSGTSMAAPHVAGVAALAVGNSSMSPAQVASRLSADATRGVVTGLSSSTVNALLYQSVNSNVVNGDISDDETPGERQSTESDSDVNDAEYDTELPPPPVSGAPAVTAPVVGAPALTAPSAAVPSASRIGVKSVTRVGKKFRVRIDAPKGAHVTLFQNGRKVSAGTKSTFSVRAVAGKRVRFHVVAKINGAIVKSTVQTFSSRPKK